MRRFLRDNGLTIALVAAFLGSICGMSFTGWAYQNENLAQHHAPPVSYFAYVSSSPFISAVFENWESEFLQMAAYVVLTAVLFQRGSAESRDPDEPYRPGDELPFARRASRVWGWIYAHSLGLALAALFLASFVGHWLASVGAANEEAAQHGRPAQSAVAYFADPGLWFESLQNWQSEFLATAALVVLSIFLRHRGSPESKRLASADNDTGE